MITKLCGKLQKNGKRVLLWNVLNHFITLRKWENWYRANTKGEFFFSNAFVISESLDFLNKKGFFGITFNLISENLNVSIVLLLIQSGVNGNSIKVFNGAGEILYKKKVDVLLERMLFLFFEWRIYRIHRRSEYTWKLKKSQHFLQLWRKLELVFSQAEILHFLYKRL